MTLSPLRAKLASFEHAYAVALHLRRETGAGQYIIRTCDPARPFRIAARPPRGPETLTARVA